MSALSKYCLLAVLISVYGQLYAVEQNADHKYKGYEFLPVYPQAGQSDIHAINVLESALEEGVQIKLLDSSTLESDVVFAYILEFTREGVNEYRRKSMELASKGVLMEYPTFDGVSVIKDNKVIDLLKANHRPKKGEDRQLWPQGGMGGYDFYGCIYEKPIFKAALFDPEALNLFVVTGTGNYTSNIRGGGTNDSLALHVFSYDSYQKIFDVQLMEVNYKPFNPDVMRKDYYFPKSDYPARDLSFNDDEGRKSYSKIFIRDFDENNLLDILVWKREYKSKKVTNGVQAGFELANDGFTHYEENATSIGFDKKPITNEMAKAWLEESNLTWKSGWPNENLCTQPGRRALPMVGIGDDPILKQ